MTGASHTAWLTESQKHSEKTRLPPPTALHPPVRTGSAARAAPTPSLPVRRPLLTTIPSYSVNSSFLTLHVFFCSNLPADQTHGALPCRKRPGERLQLLSDSGGWRKVRRELVGEKLWGSTPRLSRVAASSWTVPEELCEPASAQQQVCV